MRPHPDTTAIGALEALPAPQSQVSACLQRRKRLLQTPRHALAQHVNTAYAETEQQLKAWVSFNPLDERAGDIAGTHAPSSLQGIPCGIKDVIDVQGLPTRAGSLSRMRSLPREKDAEVVGRLRAIGIEIPGKTVTTEFAYLDPGATTNPFDASRTPGGSSSGSGAAVGAGVIPLALGTQTAGSVCRPAAYCGTYAFKPSTGSTPTAGVVPLAADFDTVGVYGLDLTLVCDAALALLGQTRKHKPGLQPLRIGYLTDPYYQTIAPECRENLASALECLARAGHRLRPCALGLDYEALRAEHRAIMHYCAYQQHGSDLHQRPETLGAHWRQALESGAGLSRQRIDAARQALLHAKTATRAASNDVDLFILPPTRDVAPRGLQTTGDAGLIIPWTYLGSPLIVIPTGLSAQRLPVSVMLAGQPGTDAQCAALALQIDGLLRSEGLAIDIF